MSSLAATQADGYYLPSSYIESGAYKKQSISQFAGSSGHNQFMQKGVVRFEVPIHGVCTSCGAAIRKGTRFNAKKERVGEYYSSKIYSFTFACNECKGSCEIRNDPASRDYLYSTGIRKKVTDFDPLDAGTSTFESGPRTGSQAPPPSDPIAALERGLAAPPPPPPRPRPSRERRLVARGRSWRS